MKTMQGLPWEPVPGREGVEVMSRIRIPEIEGTPEPYPNYPAKEVRRRRLPIMKADVENTESRRDAQDALQHKGELRLGTTRRSAGKGWRG